MPANAAAMIGAMVESAPTDIRRLAPKIANPSEPAAKANNPLIGGMPTSRAVANCSGMAIAASVIAAMASPGNQEARNSRKGANNQPACRRGLAMVTAGFSWPCSFAMPDLLLCRLVGAVSSANGENTDAR